MAARLAVARRRALPELAARAAWQVLDGQGVAAKEPDSKSDRMRDPEGVAADPEQGPAAAAMARAPLRLARLLGQAPYVTRAGRLRLSAALRGYSVALLALQVCGAAGFVLSTRTSAYEDDVSWRLLLFDLMDIIAVLVAAAGAVYVVRRQHPLLLPLLEAGGPGGPGGPRWGGVPAARALAVPLLSAARALYFTALLLYYPEFNGVATTAMRILMEAHDVLSAVSLCVFLFLLGGVPPLLAAVRDQLAGLRRSKRAGADVAARLAQVRRDHEAAVDELDRVCECCGPQAAVAVLARCALIVNQVAYLPDTVVAIINYRLLPSASSLLFYADRILKTLVDGASLVAVLQAADEPTEKGEACTKESLSLINSGHLSVEEAKEVELLILQLGMRPAQVNLCRFLTLDLSITLGSLSSLATYVIAIIQMRDMTVEHDRPGRDFNETSNSSSAEEEP